jgi:hypothetical protein
MNREMTASPELRGMEFILRGEGEEALRRFVNALVGERNWKTCHLPDVDVLP